MNEFLPAELSATWLLPAALVALLVAWLVIRHRRGKARSLENVLNAIAFERLQGLIIPKADEGEIQIDHLILTAQGLLIIEIKDVQGAVFGSDKMQDWTVIGEENRFTFSNPQPALYDRIAAVRQVVRQVPVAGRIVFLDGASFTKGIPSLVCNLDELLEDFGEQDKAAAKSKIVAFKPHWEQIQNLAEQSGRA
jgi:hypothetical protein